MLIDLRKIRCSIGIHKIKKQFAWSGEKRLDVCYRCTYSRWLTDIKGHEKMERETLLADARKSQLLLRLLEKRRVIIEKHTIINKIDYSKFSSVRHYER